MRVLIAEDDVNLSMAWRFALERRGHRVETVHTGAAAAELLGTESFDAIVADVLMPHCGALTLAHQRQLRCPHARFIAVTGLAAYMPNAYGEGGVPEADVTLGKPFGLGELVRAVEGGAHSTEWDARWSERDDADRRAGRMGGAVR